MNLLDVALLLVERATAAGAEEVSARASRSTSATVTQRDGRLEAFRDAQSLSASVALLVDGRYSTHTTSDLRPAALGPFLERAVAATRHLEVDLHRRLPERARLGVGDLDRLELADPSWAGISPSDRAAQAQALEAACRDHGARAPIRSVTATVEDSRREHARATSHGFTAHWASTGFGLSAGVSLEDEGGRLPEGYNAFRTRHRADLLPAREVAADAIAQAEARLGSRPAPSGRYPMLLDARLAWRPLGVLLAPLAGSAVYERRSCLADRLGERIAASGFTLLDDPTLPRGIGSRPCDADGLAAVPRPIVSEGVLQCFLLDVYNARRLGMEPTTGSTSNLVVPPGTRAPETMARDLAQAIRVEGLLGGNANAATGDFSFGVNGTLLAHGEPAARLSEMNVSGNLFDLLDRFVEAACDTWTWSNWRSPTLLFDGIQFSGT